MATLPKNPPISHARASTIAATSAKARFLELLDIVDRKRSTITITKRGRAVAKLIPIKKTPEPDIFGYMKGTIKITGDIISPEPDIWEAMSE